MCLRPIKIRNPTKRLDYRGGQKLLLQVPCGQCAQCVTNKRMEWYFRTFQHAQNVLNNGGYVYFDTLTYADEYLPMLSHFVDVDKKDDFSVFNHTHFKLFLKNLRRQLHYHYKLDKCFTYFLTSEYGVDDRYTHRPHYHILFFVDGRLDPLKFSELVGKCWIYGLSDGINYKPLPYVAAHIYGKDLGFTKHLFSSVLSVCMYVSKYINKSSSFTKRLNKRLDKCVSLVKNEDEFRALKRNVDMFHRQSQGFGISYLHNLTPFHYNLIMNGQVSFINNKKLLQTMPLPMYYKRKLFYDCKKRSDNTRYWELNQNGLEYMRKRLDSLIDSLTTKYDDMITNFTPSQQDNIKQLLRGRSLRDFSLYKYLYQGRLRDLSYINLYRVDFAKVTIVEDVVRSWFEQILSSSQANSFVEADVLLRTDDDLVEIPINNFPFYFWHSARNQQYLSYDSFCRKYTFNDKVFPLFEKFDSLDNYIEHCELKFRKSKQSYFDYVEDLKLRTKQSKIYAIKKSI